MSTIDLSTPTMFHPLVREAFELYRKGKRNLDARAIAELQARIDDIASDLQALFEALSGLGALAKYLADNGDTVGHDALVRLIRRQAPRFDPVRDRLPVHFQDRADAMRTRLEKLTSRAAPPRVAALHRAPSPNGPLPLRTFLPRTRRA